MPGTSAYPGGIDDFTDPDASAGDKFSTPAVAHDEQHGQVNRAVNQIEDALGADPHLIDDTATVAGAPTTLKNKTDKLWAQVLAIMGTADAQDAPPASLQGILNTIADVDSDLAELSKSGINIVLNGGGNAVPAGIIAVWRAPFTFNFVSWSILIYNPATGSIVVDIWKDTYANHPPTVADTITAAAKPTVSAANKAESSALTGWTTLVNEGDLLVFNIDSIASIVQATIFFAIERVLPV